MLLVVNAGGIDLERVAAEAGFGTAESLRRALKDALGTSPTEYRERFGTTRKDTGT